MSHIDQLRESIDARIVEVKNETAALQAARAALRNESATSKPPAVSAKKAPPSRRRRTSKALSSPTSAETPTSAGDGAALRSESASSKAPAVSAKETPPGRRRRPSNAASNLTSAETPTSAGADLDALETPSKPTGPPKPRSRAHRKPAASARPAEVLLAGKLEIMLGESEDGLSALTISKRSNASYKQVVDLLRELEQTGQVRRSGSRRTSLWRRISDEERIAERSAELERVSSGTSAT
jgi:hypothetical protein